MSTFNLSDDVLFRFENACSLGQEAEKEISLNPADAALFLNIFETSLQEDPTANPALIQARDVFKRLTEGEVVTLYDSEKIPADKKATDVFQQTVGGRRSNYVDVKEQGLDWCETARAVIREKLHLERAAKFIESALKASDTTTIAELKEAAAREYTSIGMHEKAFELRTQITQLSFPPNHCLSDMEHAVVKGSEGKPLSRMGAYFQDLDTGCVKRGTLHASKRRIVNDSSDSTEVPQERLCFDFSLTHCARKELDQTLRSIQEHPDDLARISGHSIKILQGKGTKIPAYVQDRDIYALDTGCSIGQSVEIEIDGVGKVSIQTDPEQHFLYNRVEISLDAQTNRGPEGLRNLHTILSLLGLGTTLCPSRPEDETRMKIFILLHAFFPSLSYQMERDPQNYTISIEALRQKICSIEPQSEAILKKYLDTNPGLFVKEELYSGRQTYMIKDMGDQVQDLAPGLFFGTKCNVCAGLSWENQKGAKEDFRKIAAAYVQKLQAGVAMESNREDWLCRGDVKAGASPVEDLRVGGFDSVFTRLLPKAFVDRIDILKVTLFCFDGIRVLLDRDVIGYASCYAYPSDQFGTRVDHDPFGVVEIDEKLHYSKRCGLLDFARHVQAQGIIEKDQFVPPIATNEVLIRDLIPSKFVRALVVKRPVMKEVLVEELRKAGLIQKRGDLEYVVLPGCEKPVDEFIYVGDTCQSEMWAKPTQQSTQK